MTLAADGVSPWAWHPHPEVWVLSLLALALYYLGVTSWRPAAAAPVPRSQAFAFVAGVVTFWAGADWPIHDISEKYLLSVHMTQHLLFTLVMPPLILAGTPPWLARRVLAPVLPIVRRLARPLLAGVVFNGLVVFSHWPAVVDIALRSEPVHFLVHLALVSTAFLMWMPVFPPVPEIRALSAPSRMLYLFAQSVVPTVPASFLTFAESPLYQVYALAPRAFGYSAVADQQLAGAIMKLAGGAVLWTMIIVMFFRWYAAEQRSDAVEAERALTWSDVERELASTPAPREP